MIEYLLARQSSRQWNGFLSALSAELSSHLGVDECRALMHRAGLRFASQTPLPACETVQEMQHAMSEVWLGMEWGWVSLHETPQYLSIQHFCTPLQAAFGAEHAGGMAAFLEGVYQHWFHSLGSGPALVVRQATEPDRYGFVEYRLGH